MPNNFVAENRRKYECLKCEYACSKNSDYTKHLLTTKHKILTNPNQKVANVASPFMCSCGKSYRHSSSLSCH